VNKFGWIQIREVGVEIMYQSDVQAIRLDRWVARIKSGALRKENWSTNELRQSDARTVRSHSLFTSAVGATILPSQQSDSLIGTIQALVYLQASLGRPVTLIIENYHALTLSPSSGRLLFCLR